MPKAPIIFSKVPESVIGPGVPIRIDATVSTAVDYEVELAVIVGKQGRNIAKAEAMAHVWGYTIVNDVTARDLQGLHSQWLIGKSQDSFCPMGPWAVTADAIDLADTSVKCWVNGELRQNGNTGEMIFDLAQQIEHVTKAFALETGDLIFTGTPAGVGVAFTQPKFLKVGDTVKVEVERLGAIETVIAQEVAQTRIG